MASTVPIADEFAPVEPPQGEPVAPAPSRPKPYALIWAVIACVFLGSSAVVRTLQFRRHQQEASWTEACPFPLERVPRKLGNWVNLVDEPKLDSKTMLITGGKEHTIRTYTDDLTGVKLVVLILFGPVEPVIPHVPEACYPANGFRSKDQSLIRTIKYSVANPSDTGSSEQSATFRSLVYEKAPLLEGVYYSFRYNGEWSPDVNSGGKFPRRNPGVFKVQVQRVMTPGESRDIDKYPDPIEDFLKSLMPALEREIVEGTARQGTQYVPVK
jgi:hypothetical protein